MNIFFLDWDIDKCAKDHCDKHVVKMILETAQLLCSTHHMTDQVTDHELGNIGSHIRKYTAGLYSCVS